MKHFLFGLCTTYCLITLYTCQAEIITNPDDMEPHTITILALGDSYTIGEGVAADERWPALLADTLKALGNTVDSPVIIAKTGWTTGELQAGIVQANPQGPYDRVTLLIGVNNQYRGGAAGFTPDVYRKEFTALLKQAISFSGDVPEHVLVISIPDYGVTPFADPKKREQIAREIDLYNAINKEEAMRAGAHYADITPISRLAATDHSLIAPDRLHPSGKMYRQWIRVMLAELYPGS